VITSPVVMSSSMPSSPNDSSPTANTPQLPSGSKLKAFSHKSNLYEGEMNFLRSTIRVALLDLLVVFVLVRLL
jgi:hypothetical protein